MGGALGVIQAESVCLGADRVDLFCGFSHIGRKHVAKIHLTEHDRGRVGVDVLIVVLVV